MGIFDVFKNKHNGQENYSVPVSVSSAAGNEVFLDLTKNGALNLEKKQFLNLEKASVALSNLRAAAGWDFMLGRAYDLDLCAMLFDSNGQLVDTVYYGKKNANGISLDGDNLTGEGKGDDENIRMNLSKVSNNVSTIAICVVIYQGKERNQYFSGVKNAYVRLVDENQKKEICRYSLTDDGGKNTAIHFADVIRTNEGWIFKAVGEYMNGSIHSVSNNLF